MGGVDHSIDLFLFLGGTSDSKYSCDVAVIALVCAAEIHEHEGIRLEHGLIIEVVRFGGIGAKAHATKGGDTTLSPHFVFDEVLYFDFGHSYFYCPEEKVIGRVCNCSSGVHEL